MFMEVILIGEAKNKCYERETIAGFSEILQKR